MTVPNSEARRGQIVIRGARTHNLKNIDLTIPPRSLVVMTGDNIYGADTPAEMKRKFEDPYAALLAKDVKFYASLGNHDNPNQRFYKLYNMGGEKYYTFRPKQGVRFFALDSNYLDPKQLAWLEKELAASGSVWKIAFFHHPLYSSGRNHGPALSTREAPRALAGLASPAAPVHTALVQGGGKVAVTFTLSTSQ